MLKASASSSSGGLKWIPYSRQFLIPGISFANTCLLEIAKDVLPAPGGILAAEFAPDIIITRRSSLEHLSIDGRATTDDAADSNVERSIIELRARLRRDVIRRPPWPIAIPLCIFCKPTIKYLPHIGRESSHLPRYPYSIARTLSTVG